MAPQKNKRGYNKSNNRAQSFGIHTYEGRSYRKKQAAQMKTRRIITFTIILVIIALLVAFLIHTFKNKETTKTPESLSTKATSSAVTTKANETTTLAATTTAQQTTATSSGKNEGSVNAKGVVSFSATAEYKKGHTYCVAVNRQQNVVTAYGKDANGEYTKPVKSMLCSCGIGNLEGGVLTPAGTFMTSRKDRWLLLVGSCWGQYTTKVHGSIFFHSVPYYTQSNSDLQYEEFPKLGSAASHGCIRVSTADAKWLYDNLELGGMVFIYDSSVPGPLGKPSNVPFDVTSKNKGWDPTDPDVNNPWKK